tara:strand:+ start:3392 stop:3556 length:165 start_codon:yes stop_codon:yes gene_type:complete
MIWTLWIISSITGLEEPKYTMYGNYEKAIECYQAWYEVTINFTEGEVAYCGTST